MNWTHILIHHSATEDSNISISWGAIEDFHVNTQKWKDIGYHFGVEEINNRLYALVGRGLDQPGAHCYQASMNDKAIGICVVGNYDDIGPRPELLKFLARRLINPLQRQFNIPAANVLFHRDFAPKSCPGTKFTREMLAPYLVQV